MRAKAIAAFLAATACAALLLSPGGAVAHPKPASRQLPPSIGQSMVLRGTNGFVVSVTVSDRRRLTLTAERGGRMLVSTSYSLRTRPRRGSDDIVARLGKLGRIDVRFVAQKTAKEKPPRNCQGGKTVVEGGYFVGMIAFRGERGYTRVRAHRAHGVISRTPPLTCRSTAPDRKQEKRELERLEHMMEKMEKEEEKEGETGDEGVRAFTITANSRTPHVALLANRVSARLKHGKGLTLTNIVVTGDRRRGRIKENSFAFDLLDKGSVFRVPNRQPATAELVLEPPAPFSGTGTFRRHSPQPPTWTGDLKVDLPGFGVVRLTGSHIKASMCDGLTCLFQAGGTGQSLLRRLAGAS